MPEVSVKEDTVVRGDAGLDALQIEVEGGEEGLVGSDLAGVAMGTLCHREGGKMALSNFLRLIEVLSRAQDGDAAKRMHGEEILVASEDHVCLPCCSESQKFIVFGIATGGDWSNRLNEMSCFPQIVKINQAIFLRKVQVELWAG